jgi:nitrate reductase NapE component
MNIRFHALNRRYNFEALNHDRQWKKVLALAGIGLLAASLAYLALVISEKTTATAIWLLLRYSAFILCPWTYLSVMCIDCTYAGWDNFIVYSMVVFPLNVALYAGIGFLIFVKRVLAAPPVP